MESRLKIVEDELREIKKGMEKLLEELEKINKQAYMVKGGFLVLVAVGGILLWVPNMLKSWGVIP